MTDNQQTIINFISAEITSALSSANHYYCSEDPDRDKIESYQQGYIDRADRLRRIREQLENEFTTTMYDPR